MPTRWLLVCGVAGPVLFMVVAFVEGMARADYDPVRHQVSLLSLADRGWIQVANFLVSGLLIVGFAAGLRRVVTPGRAANAGPVAVGAAGSGLVIAGLFSVQPSFGYPPGAPAGIPAPEPGSYLHVLGAFLFFFGMIVAAFMFAARFRAAERGGWAAFSIGAGLLVLAFFAASSGGPDGQPLVPEYVGLLQRISIVTGLGWIAALAAGLLSGLLRFDVLAGADTS